MSTGRPTVMNLIGATLDDRYEIIALLGEGGMGAVYRARQQGGPDVAIKVLHEELGDNTALRERFEREARALFGLEHPNILHVVDFGVHDKRPYLAMELLDGQPLDRLIEDGPLPPHEAYELGQQVLRGLAFAHANGVLHRDLKAENVFVTTSSDGRTVAKLLDFGLVKFTDDERWGSSSNLTTQGAIFGTPAYMAPEQCTGASIDTRGDVYSAGVILFEIFTGVWPFMEETRVKMFQAHLGKTPPRLSDATEGRVFRHELESVVARALAKNPNERFRDAQAMLAAFEAVPQPVATRAGAAPTSANRRQAILFATVFVAVLAIGAALAVGILGGQ